MIFFNFFVLELHQCLYCNVIFLAWEYEGEITIAKVNVDDNPISPSKFGVRGIPALFLFKNGEMVSSKVGASPKASLQSWIEENK